MRQINKNVLNRCVLHQLTVDLLAVDTFDVDNPLLTVDLNNLALTALQGTANDQDFVVFADGNGTSLFVVVIVD